MSTKSVQMELNINNKLDAISLKRRLDGDAAWRKKDIIAELVTKAHKKEIS